MQFDRFTEPLDRGFDIINNKGFEGVSSIKRFMPIIKPKASVWERVVANAGATPPARTLAAAPL